MSSSDLFQTLPRATQTRIDKAFDATVSPNWEHNKSSASRTPSTSTSKLDSGGGFILSDSLETGGGFLVEDPGPSGGGFLVDDEEADADEDTSERPRHIPMSLIPAALQRLDLPPDDEEILSVFRNAASGWSSSTNTVTNVDEINEDFVSRDDWRSVCAVLLEDRGSDDEVDEGDDDDEVRMRQESEDDDDRSDEYRSQDSDEERSEGDEEDSDEYVEGPSTSTNRRRTRAKGAKSSSPGVIEVSSKPKKPTARQQETCLEAFALFFPSVSPSELPNQKIMIKDIQRVAKVLGEKIKAEEMVEMLEMFSNSPDKSMNLADFSRMMITAKLA